MSNARPASEKIRYGVLFWRFMVVSDFACVHHLFSENLRKKNEMAWAKRSGVWWRYPCVCI